MAADAKLRNALGREPIGDLVVRIKRLADVGSPG